MKLVVGLGNPGEKYIGNRHNAGFMVVDRLAKVSEFSNSKFQFSNKFKADVLVGNKVMLVKPQTFMNRSGEAVSTMVNFYKASLDDLIVVHDDLDIRLGDYKIVNGVGPKVHNGLNSIESKLGRTDFWRVRVGVDNRIQNSEARMAGEDYVLSDFTLDERTELDEVIKAIIDELVPKLT